MEMPGKDVTHIVYQGPPRWDGSKWVNGDRFHLSGRPYQAQEGIELAKGIEGAERGIEEYRYNTTANIPGMTFVDSIAGHREIMCAINIFGDTAKELRENKQRWFRNHPVSDPGRLWFFSSNSMPRYMAARKSEKAAIGSLEQDPALMRRYKDLEWGWISDGANFYGYREEILLKKIDGNRFYARIYNPSTAQQVYPILYFPGPGSWTFSLGFERRNFQTPILEAGSEIKIDFSPKNQTFLHRSREGVVTNVWPKMVGQRPRWSLEAETWTDYVVTHSSGDASLFITSPKVVFTPEYTSWN